MNKVLVVEDDQGIRQIIKHNLVRESFAVFEAEDGVEGLAVAQSSNPDLVILDVEMPKMDGFSLLEIIRGDGNETPVIITSNLGQGEGRGIADKFDVLHYFVKSDSNLKEIIEYIKNIN